jgi:hypothetical protein
MAIGDSYFVQTFTTTLQRYEKQLVDNVLLEHPVLELFKSAAKSITGRGLVIPVRGVALEGTGYVNASAASAQFATGFSNETLGSVVYDWADEILTPFRLKHRDILQNTGPEQIVNLVQAYVEGATAAHKDFIVAELHKLRASWSAGKVLSLDMLVADTDKVSTTVAQSVVGGVRGGVATKSVTDYERAGTTATLTIGANDYIVGDSVVVTGVIAALAGTFTLTAVTATTISYTTGTSATVGTTATTGSVTCDDIKTYWSATRISSSAAAEDIVAAFRRVTNEIFRDSRKRPTHVICGFTVYEQLEAFLSGNNSAGFARTLYNDPNGKAQTRFTGIQFGDLEVRLDPDCQDDRAYFLNMPSLRFAYCAGEFMKSYPAQPLEGTLDTVVPLASTILFGVSERRANGLLIRTA